MICSTECSPVLFPNAIFFAMPPVHRTLVIEARPAQPTYWLSPLALTLIICTETYRVQRLKTFSLYEGDGGMFTSVYTSSASF